MRNLVIFALSVLVFGCGPSPMTIKQLENNKFFVEVVKPFGPGELEAAREEFKIQVSTLCKGGEYIQEGYNEGKKKSSSLDLGMLTGGIVTTSSSTVGMYVHATSFANKIVIFWI